MINRLRNDPTPIRHMRPDLNFTDAVESVLNKGMARDVINRYGTAPEFAGALGAASRGEGAGVLGRLFGR